jgi:hypothetical protein
MMALTTAATHLYPGAHLSAAEKLIAPVDVVVIFGGTNPTGGRVEELVNGEMALRLEEYVTLAGTVIAAKSWLVRRDGPGLIVTGRES